MAVNKVFISHTADMASFPADRSFVQAALDAVDRAGLAPVDMRYFSGRDEKPEDYCRQLVRECDIYIAVVGFRYGSAVPGKGISYTELEFGEASSAGLTRLIFLLEDSANLPMGMADRDRRPIDSFRRRLRDAGLIAGSFRPDAAAAELEVFHALSQVQDSGKPKYPTVYVSYSHHDRRVADVLIEQLSAAGIRVFWDKDLPAGENFSEVLVGAISQSDVVIAIVSPDYLASDWAQGELATALTARKLVLPVLVRPTRLNGPLAYIQPLDATGEPGAAADRVIQILAGAR